MTEYKHLPPSDFYLMRKRRDAIDDPQLLCEHLEEENMDKELENKRLRERLVELQAQMPVIAELEKEITHLKTTLTRVGELTVDNEIPEALDLIREETGS